MKRLVPGTWFTRNQRNGLARVDLQSMATALATFIENPGRTETGEAKIEPLKMDFPCQQVIVNRAEKGLGLIAAVAAQFNDGTVVLLFMKEGRNLSNRDRADIREAYDEELRRRMLEAGDEHDN